MTNEQINRAIAKQRGEYETDVRVVAEGDASWTLARIPESFPDYCKDWAAAGPLMVTMADVQRDPRLSARGRAWCLHWARMGSVGVHVAEGDTPTEAIARAYHAAFCNEASR